MSPALRLMSRRATQSQNTTHTKLSRAASCGAASGSCRASSTCRSVGSTRAAAALARRTDALRVRSRVIARRSWIWSDVSETVCWSRCTWRSSWSLCFSRLTLVRRWKSEKYMPISLRRLRPRTLLAARSCAPLKMTSGTEQSSMMKAHSYGRRKVLTMPPARSASVVVSRVLTNNCVFEPSHAIMKPTSMGGFCSCERGSPPRREIWRDIS
mmetsp:Transcript_43255/g.119650  ORF Transcript_43255/g.119650 Transcript_43255/m.119650 type:complete len:212 (+) Transcript_43255:120-755(+)